MGRTIERSSEGVYSTDYINQCFYIWYAHGRPTIPVLMPFIPEDNTGMTPQPTTVSGWKRKYGWDEEASRMDESVRHNVEKKYIQEKSAMLSKHAEIGRKLQERGMEYLESATITSAHAAIRAIEVGIAVEKDSTNLEKLLDTVSRMDDAKLMKRLDDLLGNVQLDVDKTETSEALTDGE